MTASQKDSTVELEAPNGGTVRVDRGMKDSLIMSGYRDPSTTAAAPANKARTAAKPRGGGKGAATKAATKPAGDGGGAPTGDA